MALVTACVRGTHVSVLPSFYSGPPATPPPPHCTVTATSIVCTGFGGPAQLVYIGNDRFPYYPSINPTVLGAPDYRLYLGSASATAAYTANKVAVMLPNATAAAFRAAFSFQFSGTNLTPVGGRGLVFVLNSGKFGAPAPFAYTR